MAISIEEMNAQTAQAVPAREVMTTWSRRSSYKANVLNGNLDHALNGNFSGNDVLNGNNVAVFSGNETDTKTVTDVVGILGLDGGRR